MKLYKNWKGGITAQKIPLYDTYATRLSPIEDVRRNPEHNELIQVKCAYCGKWISPTLRHVTARIYAIEKSLGSEIRFYCDGPTCRQQCPIYKKVKYPNGFAIASSREVQPELRKIVFLRDNYQCQKCGSGSSLHCHHIDPVSVNPIESADIDNCLTLCKTCHVMAHKIDGCSGSDLRNCTPSP